MEYHRDNLNQVKLKLIRYLNLRIDIYQNYYS